MTWQGTLGLFLCISTCYLTFEVPKALRLRGSGNDWHKTSCFRIQKNFSLPFPFDKEKGSIFHALPPSASFIPQRPPILYLQIKPQCPSHRTFQIIPLIHGVEQLLGFASATVQLTCDANEKVQHQGTDQGYIIRGDHSILLANMQTVFT